MMKKYISLSVLLLLSLVDGHKIKSSYQISMHHTTTDDEKNDMDIESALNDDSEALQTG